MPITVTIQAESFSELFKLIRDIPMRSVSVSQTDDPQLPLQFPAPQQPQADEPVNPNPPLVDKTGTAWNEAIHASSKALNADGTWRRKRGLPKDEAPPPVTTMPPVQPQMPPVATMPPVQPQMPPVATMPPVAAQAPMDYAGLMSVMGQKMATGVLTNSMVGQILVEFGLSNFQEIIPRPDLIAPIYARINAL